ncbi:hypothetical protein DPMN_177386 [Dreissena polymorpha]|uniref:Uncharacterized protein n=1 Tax=Dreissena polymorpha TaxID=45954 RepID=A0A9D4EB33_DREPO|nr:hypothetical protein DPMN_177386 [Dreissena polymorpha]
MRQSPGVKNAPPTGGHVLQATGTIFELVQNIIGTNLLTKFHDDRKIPRPVGGHVFPPTGTIFKLIQDIIGTNHLTKFHDDRTINVASRELTRKNAPPLGSHVFQANTNLLTNFHENWTINVASRVLKGFTTAIYGKLPRPPGSHVFSPISTIFELVRDIKETNVLIKFHDDWAKIVTSRVFTRKTAPPPAAIFELNINVASRVFTRQNVDDGRTTDKRRSQKLTMRTLCSGELKTEY